MQIHDAGDFGNLITEPSFTKDTESITLKGGQEYYIDVTPIGRISSEALKSVDINDRNCLNENENPIEGSIFKKYTEKNCKFECRTNLAEETCGCIPWDFKTFQGNTKECDVFGRSCFYAEMKSLIVSPTNLCPQCKVGCDDISFKKSIEKDINLSENLIATGSNYLYQFTQDKLFVESAIINFNTLTDNSTNGNKVAAIDKLRNNFMNDAIVIHVRYLEPQVEYLDVSYSIWDKFANFGGNFGIFAEITGISFLGTLNCIILLIKLASSKILSKEKANEKNKANLAKGSSENEDHKLRDPPVIQKMPSKEQTQEIEDLESLSYMDSCSQDLEVGTNSLSPTGTSGATAVLSVRVEELVSRISNLEKELLETKTNLNEALSKVELIFTTLVESNEVSSKVISDSPNKN